MPRFPSLYQPRAKPNVGAQIDRAHPLSQGLTIAYLFNEAAGAALLHDSSGHGYHAVPNHAAQASQWVRSPYGSALNFVVANTDFLTVTQPATLSSPRPNRFTFVVVLSVATIGSNLNIWGSTATGEKLMRISSGKIQITDTAPTALAAATASLAVGPWYAIAATRHDTAGGFEIWVNGAKVALTTNNTTTAVVEAAGTHYVGQKGAASIYYGGAIACLYLYNRDLSAGEAQQITTQPYAMFRDSAFQVWMGALTAVTITGTGALTAPPAILAVSSAEKEAATGAVSAPHGVLGAVGHERESGSGGLTASHAGLTASGTEKEAASGAFVAPHAILVATSAEKESATGAVSAPHASLSALSSEKEATAGALIAPHTVLTASGTETLAASGSEIAPHSTLAATGAERLSATGSIVAASSALAAVATETLTAIGALAAPLALLGSSGAVSESAAGTIVGAASLAASTTETLNGTAIVVAPASALSATGVSATGAVTASGGIVAPAPSLAGFAQVRVTTGSVLRRTISRIDAVAALVAPLSRLAGRVGLVLSGDATIASRTTIDGRAEQTIGAHTSLLSQPAVTAASAQTITARGDVVADVSLVGVSRQLIAARGGLRSDTVRVVADGALALDAMGNITIPVGDLDATAALALAGDVNLAAPGVQVDSASQIALSGNSRATLPPSTLNGTIALSQAVRVRTASSVPTVRAQGRSLRSRWLQEREEEALLGLVDDDELLDAA